MNIHAAHDEFTKENSAKRHFIQVVSLLCTHASLQNARCFYLSLLFSAYIGIHIQANHWNKRHTRLKVISTQARIGRKGNVCEGMVYSLSISTTTIYKCKIRELHKPRVGQTGAAMRMQIQNRLRDPPAGTKYVLNSRTVGPLFSKVVCFMNLRIFGMISHASQILYLCDSRPSVMFMGTKKNTNRERKRERGKTNDETKCTLNGVIRNHIITILPDWLHHFTPYGGFPTPWTWIRGYTILPTKSQNKITSYSTFEGKKEGGCPQ